MKHRYLPISKGMKTKIDKEDFERLSRDGFLKWNAQIVGKKVYASKNVGRHRKVYLHRYLKDAPTGMVVDHIDGDSLNNTKANLRLCYHRDNIRNSKGKEGRQSEFKGVSQQSRGSRSWFAQISIGKEHVSLGSYSCPEDAAKAYDIAAMILFGDFCKPNYAASRKFLKLRRQLLSEHGIRAA